MYLCMLEQLQWDVWMAAYTGNVLVWINVNVKKDGKAAPAMNVCLVDLFMYSYMYL